MEIGQAYPGGGGSLDPKIILDSGASYDKLTLQGDDIDVLTYSGLHINPTDENKNL
jgi:hypothetical protein